MIYQKIANVQQAVTNVKKDADNPFFHSKYATYESVMEALRPYLEREKLLVIHGFGEPKFEGTIAVTTFIVDLEKEGGEVGELSSSLYIPTVKDDPQAAGSAITYAKRYMVLAMFGLGTEDDDGEKATTHSTSSPNQSYTPKQTTTNIKPRNPSAKATPKQVDAIYKMAKHAGVDLADLCMDFDIQSVEGIDMAKASEIIKYLSRPVTDGTDLDGHGGGVY